MSRYDWTRRQFLLATGSVAVAGFTGIGCSGSSNGADTDLIQPQVRSSRGGILSTTLSVGFAANTIGGQQGGTRIFTRTFEGRVPGPTLRVRPGDVMNIRFRNDLPPNMDVPPVNHLLPHAINTTNLHTHGLHVSPAGNSDNVLIKIDPGQTFDYSIAIPANHPGGTMWYHPHNHGSVTTQIQGGMSGALIIEGAIDDVPEIRAARDVVLVLHELRLDDAGQVEPPNVDTDDIAQVYPATQTLYTVNGQLNPVIRARPGEVLRWRFVNATVGTFYPLALDGHDLHPIAFDGITLPRRGTSAGEVLGPGNRMDVLIRAGEPGTYLLRGLEYSRSDTIFRAEVVLMTLVVEGAALDMGLPDVLPAPYADIGDGEITGRREIVFPTEDNTGQVPGYPINRLFLIDGKVFDAERVDQLIDLGAVEEWTIRNPSSDDHNFHIHTNPVELVAVNDAPLATPVWYDTVYLPRNHGSVTIRSRFLDFTGKLVLHCHILNHEDLGMMQLVEISG